MLATLIRTVVAAAVSIFYRLERQGPRVPSGPLVIAANHPNSLLDPVILFATAGRTPRPLAKAPLFRRQVIGRLIRWVGGIPVYRREDDPARMGQNRDTFQAATAALREGDAIQIFPEGRSHSDPELSPLHTGAARIALTAEAEAGWTLGLGLMPLGLTYVMKAFFRGRVVARYGEPIRVADYRESYERNGRGAARELTEALDRRLRELTLNLTETEDAALIDVAERMWAREQGLKTARERAPLSERLPRLQAFARGLAWLRVHDPARHQQLRDGVARYSRSAALLGVGEGDVPDRYELRRTLRWFLLQLIPALLLAPLALVAALVWGAPYALVGLVVQLMRLPDDVVATYKVAGSLIAYPLFLALWTILAGRAWGWEAAVGAVVVLPLLGLVAARWLDLARELVEDIRIFARVVGPASSREQLTVSRRALVAEFETVQRLVEESAMAAGGSVGGGS